MGFACNLEKHCETCNDWTDETMNKYLKHQANFERKKDNKRKRRLSKESKSSSESGSGSSHQLGTGDTGFRIVEGSDVPRFDAEATILYRLYHLSCVLCFQVPDYH